MIEEVRYYDWAGLKGFAYSVEKIVLGKWNARRRMWRARLTMAPGGTIDKPGHGRRYPSGVRGHGRFLHCWLEPSMAAKTDQDREIRRAS